MVGLTGTARPRVCCLPTAAADSDTYIRVFYETFPPGNFQPSHVGLFSRRVEDLRSFLLEQDLIYVPGGNTANLLAIWRLHGVDAILREAWQHGIVLCGVSAGALCWFECGSTDSFGKQLAPLYGCLGFLPGSHCPHYDNEERRRPTYHRYIADGMPGGWATDSWTALLFQGTELARAVRVAEGAKVYRVELVDGEVREEATTPEDLPGS